MKNQIRSIFYKHNYNFSNIDMTKDCDDIILQTESDLITSVMGLDSARKIMCELWQLQRKHKQHILEHDILKSIISEIKQNSNYTVVDGFIVCNKRIDCSAIKTNKSFHILNNNQIQKLIKLGYGINSFKLELNNTIQDIYCFGNHPNLSPTNKTFCIDNDIKDIEFTLDNIRMVELMLSQINLASCFLEKQEFDKIMEVVECQEKR